MTMLRRFSVQNYKNFKNRISLDFTRTRDYKFNTDCVRDGLLNKILLTGKNGTGKTNLAYALFDIVCTFTDNITHPLQKDTGSFLNGESEAHPRIHDKGLVNEECYNGLKQLNRYTKDVYMAIIRMRLKKENYLLNGTYEMMEKDRFLNLTGSELLEYQSGLLSQKNCVSVINTCIFMIVEHKPSLFFSDT